MKSKQEGTILKFLNNLYRSPSSLSNLNIDNNNDIYNTHNTKNNVNSLHRFKSKSRKPENSLENLSRFMQFSNASASAPGAVSTNSTSAGADESIMQAWMNISSYDFLDNIRYPVVFLPDNGHEDIKIDKNRFRINLLKTKDIKQPFLSFFFRMNKDHIYYSAEENDINVLGAIDLLTTVTVKRDNIEEKCFILKISNAVEYKICGDSENTRDKWYCGVAKRVKLTDPFCVANTISNFKPTFEFEQKVYQPIILVPLASAICNDNFDYSSDGSNWECTCKEGNEQSPIDIIKDKALKSPAAPVFSFEEIDAISPLSSLDGTMIAKEHLKIQYYKHAIRIFHTNFGKIVTLDGSVYHAEEIVFHTPAEHLLNGVRHEMEMQVIAYGQSKGDIAKQVVLSFIFEQKAGVYNKFIDDVDFFNLPNKENPVKYIGNNLFIPKVFYSAGSDDLPVMKPFSFFTYQGSITFPPCTERTIHYVAADTLPIAHTMISMLKEALREKDDQAPEDIKNIRQVQPLNGRPVFFYDASNCNVRIASSKKKVKSSTGHYEKVVRKVTEYFKVDSEEPSGLPDSFVVSENEANGKIESRNPEDFLIKKK